MTNDDRKGFYVGSWGAWGWIETGIKAVAIAVGVAAFFATSGAGGLIVGGNPELAALALMAGLTLNPLISLAIRIGQKEIISIVFTVFNLLGHVGMLLALARDPETARTFGLAFAAIYTLGELAKMRFLQVSGYTELGLDNSGMVNGVRVVAAAYALLAVLILI